MTTKLLLQSLVELKTSSNVDRLTRIHPNAVLLLDYLRLLTG